VTGPAAFGSRTYAFDGGGNRTSVQVGSGTPVTTAYDAAGLPVSSSDGTTYTHDPVGNLTSIDRTGGSNDWFFTYSSWSALTKAARTPSGSDVVFVLDALDRVLSRTLGSTTATYTYQGLGETPAKAQVGNTTTTYVSTPGGPLAQKS
jgi:YD repeat-containing protein